MLERDEATVNAKFYVLQAPLVAELHRSNRLDMMDADPKTNTSSAASVRMRGRSLVGAATSVAARVTLVSSIVACTTHVPVSLTPEANPGASAGVIVATILGGEDSLRVNGALVNLVGTSVAGVSDSTGKIMIDSVPAGPYSIEISREGYIPLVLPQLTLSGRDTLTIVARLWTAFPPGYVFQPPQPSPYLGCCHGPLPIHWRRMFLVDDQWMPANIDDPPPDLSALNVRRIEFMAGSHAAAMFGFRAAGFGVLIIETRRDQTLH